MVTNNEIKQVRALHQKKYRNQFGRFIVEGPKLVQELLQSDFESDTVYVSAEIAKQWSHCKRVLVISKEQMSRMSGMTTPPGVLAVVKIPQRTTPANVAGWTVVLNGLSDPGNLGTILRIADWFGLEQVVASSNSVDPYSQKVVQASMGATFRVPHFQTDLPAWMKQQQSLGVKIFGADMTGTSLEKVQWPSSGILVMGSESHGIDEEVNEYIHEKITIRGRGAAESLNVAVAMGVICSRMPL